MYAPPLANGCDLAKKVARPGDAAFVLAGRRPAGEHVHDVVGVPGRVGHRIGRDAGRLAADRNVSIAIHAYLLRLRLTLVSGMNHAVSPSLFTVVAND